MINREYSKRISWCSSFIDSITECVYGIEKKLALQELSILYHSNHVNIKRLDSIASNAAKRFDYLKELIEKYGALDNISRNANSFICLSVSSTHPVEDVEKQIIGILTKGQLGKHRLYVKTDDSCGNEMRIEMAFYK